MNRAQALLSNTDYPSPSGAVDTAAPVRNDDKYLGQRFFKKSLQLNGMLSQDDKVFSKTKYSTDT